MRRLSLSGTPQSRRFSEKPQAGVTGVRLRNLQTKEERVLPCSGVFIAIGHKPNTDLFKGQFDMDEVGYL